MTGKRFQKRYIEKNNKVYDTFKEIHITDELNYDSLLNVLSHLNGLGEMIDIKIEQGKYCMKKYKELEDENEQLKSANNMLKVTIGRNESYIKRLTEQGEWRKSGKTDEHLAWKRVD